MLSSFARVFVGCLICGVGAALIKWQWPQRASAQGAALLGLGGLLFLAGFLLIQLT